MPAGGSWSPWTPRSPWTTTPCSATRRTPRCATRRRRPAGADGPRARGLTYVKLDGDIGILGNGAGLVMSTLDVVAQNGGAPANFLDAGGGSKAEAITAAVEVILSNAEGQGRPLQHLRRHHPLRRGRPRPDRARSTRSSRPSRSSSASTGPTATRVVRCWPPAALPSLHTAETMDDAAELVVGWPGRRRGRTPDERDPRQRDPPLCGGDHRERGPLPRAQQPGYGTNVVGGRDAREGRAGRRGNSGLRHVRRGGPRDRGERRDDLRAARASPPTRSSRPRTPGIPTIIAITEGIPAHDELRVYTQLRRTARRCA